jgi:hypothetical protein
MAPHELTNNPYPFYTCAISRYLLCIVMREMTVARRSAASHTYLYVPRLLRDQVDGGGHEDNDLVRDRTTRHARREQWVIVQPPAKLLHR